MPEAMAAAGDVRALCESTPEGEEGWAIKRGSLAAIRHFSVRKKMTPLPEKKDARRRASRIAKSGLRNARIFSTLE